MIKLERSETRPAESRPISEQYVSDAASDARLVEEVRRGNQDAFGVLVMRYERRLHRLLRRLVHDQEQARDLAQETFLKVFQHLDQFDSSRRFGPWLFRVAVNLAVDWLRRRKPVARLGQMMRGDDNPMEVVDPDPRPRLELEQEIQRVLQDIPLNYRTVLILRDLEGFSCSEVAAIEGRREATIRWRLSRAREMFRKIWEQRQENGR
jgi:RNA polymerase sigma-70 factor (ECF subfamily)